MNVSIATVCRIRIAGTPFVLIAALMLAACQTDGTGPSAAGAPKAEAASIRPETSPEAARTQAAKPAEPADDDEPMTRARAARECWMRTEKGALQLDLDKRADVVNKCIEDKLKAAGVAAPKS